MTQNPVKLCRARLNWGNIKQTLFLSSFCKSLINENFRRAPSKWLCESHRFSYHLIFIHTMCCKIIFHFSFSLGPKETDAEFVNTVNVSVYPSPPCTVVLPKNHTHPSPNCHFPIYWLHQSSTAGLGSIFLVQGPHSLLGNLLRPIFQWRTGPETKMGWGDKCKLYPCTHISLCPPFRYAICTIRGPPNNSWHP